MALRIACDLDGTLADMEAALQREAEQLFGPDVDVRANGDLPLVPLRSPQSAAPASDPPAEETKPSRRALTDRERRGLWTRVGQVPDFWRGLGEIEPGAVARLGGLAAQHGWEVIFVTQRPSGAGATAQVQSQHWLREHGFEMPSVFVNVSRGKIADALSLDAVIDDRPDNCLDVVADSTARAILVWRDGPATVPAAAQRPGIVVVHTFSDALAYLEKMMARATPPRGVLGRLRSAFGG
jgi:hypothetical protein